MEKRTVLIIEDERPILTALRKKIEQEGFLVLTASNGEEGLRFALEYHPDLILLDIIMPHKDGLTALHELREDEWGKTAQVIMLTNLSDADAVQRSIADGAFDYLVKTDWTLEQVIAKVHEKLST